MSKIGAGLFYFWTHHVQKTCGLILAGSSVFDLMSALQLYEVTLTQILGLHLYSSLRGACALAIVVRAVWKPKGPE